MALADQQRLALVTRDSRPERIALLSLPAQPGSSTRAKSFDVDLHYVTAFQKFRGLSKRTHAMGRACPDDVAGVPRGGGFFLFRRLAFSVRFWGRAYWDRGNCRYPQWGDRGLRL